MWNRRTVVLDMKGCGQWEVTKDECYPSTMNEIIAQAVDNICESINLKPPMSVTDCTLISYETEEIGYRFDGVEIDEVDDMTFTWKKIK